jgi:glutathione S-transferase
MARYWHESEMPIADFPHVVRWLDGLAQIPAWAHPWPAMA